MLHLQNIHIHVHLCGLHTIYIRHAFYNTDKISILHYDYNNTLKLNIFGDVYIKELCEIFDGLAYVDCMDERNAGSTDATLAVRNACMQNSKLCSI